MTETQAVPVCYGCKRAADKIPEHVAEAAETGYLDAVECAMNDGTYNEAANTFWCTMCYLGAGAPAGKAPAIGDTYAGVGQKTPLQQKMHAHALNEILELRDWKLKE